MSAFAVFMVFTTVKRVTRGVGREVNRRKKMYRTDWGELANTFLDRKR